MPAETKLTAQLHRIENERRARIHSEVSMLMEAVDGITADLVKRGLWPNGGEYSAQPEGRYATASDIMSCAKSVAWKAGIRPKLEDLEPDRPAGGA
ncbi:MAG TPA: hypothetical protein VEO96_00550 [Thermoplasmata archaeon]|nr:hypothetical protein [Thermoplasmata archaeon]